MILLVSSFSYSQEDESENAINNLIEDAKSLIDKVDIDNIIPEYEYEVGVLWIKNETMRATKRENKVGWVYWQFISSKDGDKRINSISQGTKGWNLVAAGQGNEMKVIADKLNEGWEIVDFKTITEEGSMNLYGAGMTRTLDPERWVIHMKRKVKK